jgi:hypothetical protein
MAAVVVSYAAGVLPLGSSGWGIIGGVIFVGGIGLWWGSERVSGKFSG